MPPHAVAQREPCRLRHRQLASLELEPHLIGGTTASLRYPELGIDGCDDDSGTSRATTLDDPVAVWASASARDGLTATPATRRVPLHV